MPKNIVVLSDGTGQEGGRGHDSNVYKLYRMLEERTENQIVYYDQGVDTDKRKVSRNDFGVGFTENIVQYYRFIFKNFNAGDKIFYLDSAAQGCHCKKPGQFYSLFRRTPQIQHDIG